MGDNRIIQSFLKTVEDDYDMAEKYYSVISTINHLKLTQREIQLIAFTSIKGNISYSSIREEFCVKYKSSGATINNMISKLKKLRVFVKDGGKVKVNPVLVQAFDKNFTLVIKIEHVKK